MTGWWAAGSAFRGALDLPVFEFDGRKPTENGDGNLELAAGGGDLVDAAREVGERAVGDLHFLADLEGDLRDFLAGRGLDAGLDLVDLSLAQRRGLVAADESDHAAGVLDEIKRLDDHLAVLVEQLHVDEHVARVELADLGRL